jgi:hypothetical protein
LHAAFLLQTGVVFGGSQLKPGLLRVFGEPPDDRGEDRERVLDLIEPRGFRTLWGNRDSFTPFRRRQWQSRQPRQVRRLLGVFTRSLGF